LLEWAQRAAAWIVEDDYDSEYRYSSKPIASLQGMDHHDRVIYIGTFSKVMFPALRLGYIVIPPDLVERFAAMRQSMDLCPSHIPQAVMLEFIREGHFARHIRRMRPIYAERCEVLVTELGRAFGEGAAIIGDEAGMHLALLLPKLRNDRQLAARAAKESLWLSPLSASYVRQIAESRLRARLRQHARESDSCLGSAAQRAMRGLELKRKRRAVER